MLLGEGEKERWRMSVESAVEFYERLVGDEALLRKLLDSKGQGLAGFISEAGYEFTLEEFAKALKLRASSGSLKSVLELGK